MTLTLLRNGRIHTSADPDATAMAISDSMISWIGGEHAVALAGVPDRVIDLDGALVIPGFVDAHVHTTEAGLALTGLDLHSALISSALADAVTDGAGLAGWSTTGPVTQQAHAAVRAVARQQLSPAQRARAQLAFLRAAAANGIVEVHECAADGATGRADLAALLALDGPIPVRGYLAAAVTDPAQARQVLADSGAHALGGDLTVDGAIGSRTASLREPYTDF